MKREAGLVEILDKGRDKWNEGKKEGLKYNQYWKDELSWLAKKHAKKKVNYRKVEKSFVFQVGLSGLAFLIWQKFRDSCQHLANSQTNEKPEIRKQ